jgi:hypothetical protein
MSNVGVAVGVDVAVGVAVAVHVVVVAVHVAVAVYVQFILRGDRIPTRVIHFARHARYARYARDRSRAHTGLLLTGISSLRA